MDKRLQKIILKIISENNGVTEWRNIVNKTTINYWERNKVPPNASTIIKHQLDLLQGVDKVIREDKLPDIFYILTTKGHQDLDCFYKKAVRFVLYDRNNLYIMFALLISVVSLVISWYTAVKIN